MQAIIESGAPSPDGPGLRPRTPQLRALLDYWNGRRGELPFMLCRDLHPREIVELLPLVFVLDVEDRPRRYRIRLMGTGIVKRFGGEFTGRYMDELDFGAARARVLAEYDRVADRVAPHLAFSDYDQAGGRHFQAERLALPMSSDGARADRLLGAVVHVPFCGARPVAGETLPWDGGPGGAERG